MILGAMDSIFLLRLGFVKSGSHLECLHATVGGTIEMYEYQKGLFSFMAVLLSEAQTEIPVKSVNHTNLTFCHRLKRSYFEGAIMLRILCVRGKKTIIFISRRLFRFWQKPPAVSLWVSGISVWALCLLCAVHL